MPGTGPSVDPTALTVIAAAVRGRMRILTEPFSL
jgi:hypothetical protein